MFQINEQTHEEKVKMYMKLSKKELINMLIACNTVLDYHSKNSKPVYVECDHAWYQDTYTTSLQWKCSKCGQLKLNNTFTYGTTTVEVTGTGTCSNLKN